MKIFVLALVLTFTSSAFATPTLAEFVKQVLALDDQENALSRKWKVADEEITRLNEEKAAAGVTTERLEQIEAVQAILTDAINGYERQIQELKSKAYIDENVALDVFAAGSPWNYQGCTMSLNRTATGFSVKGRLKDGQEYAVNVKGRGVGASNFHAETRKFGDGRRYVHVYGFVTNKILPPADRYETHFATEVFEDMSVKQMGFSLDRNPAKAALDSRSCQ